MTTLLAVWFALLAADRIDFFVGQGPFVLTPFQALTPVLVLLAWSDRMRRREPVAVRGRAALLMLLLLALVALVVGSVFVSMDVFRSAMRAMQLVTVAFGVVMLRLLIPASTLTPGLVRGARLGVRLYAVMCLLQLLALAGVIPESLPSADVPLLRIMPSLHGGLLPRLSGFTNDSNRSGLVLLVYGAVLLWHDGRRHVGTLASAVLLMLLTLSRSSLLAAAAALAWETWQSWQRPRPRAGEHDVRVPRSRAADGIGIVAALTMAAVALVLLGAPRVRVAAARVLAPVAERFTVERGSGEDHLRLLARGVETGTRSVPVAMHGIGYGSAFLVLQDFFPGDRYGNFHSVYVGIFAEAGIFALLVTVMLIAGPLVWRTPQAPLAVAVSVFGVFYGALAEPTFWFAISAAWLPLFSNARPNATSSATATPSTAPSAS